MTHHAGTRHPLLIGLLAGAAGTVALNVVTYADMALRARAASSMPDQAVGRLAETAGVSLGEKEDEVSHRKQGLGALLGYAVGMGVGLAYGMLRSRARVPLPAATLGLGAAAMAGSDVPLVTLGLTDPRKWSGADWASDIVPHLAYGAATAAAYRLASR